MASAVHLTNQCSKNPFVPFPPLSGKRPWGFPFFAGGCATGHAAAPVQRSDVSELCTQMMLRLRDLYDPTKVLLPNAAAVRQFQFSNSYCLIRCR
jgi:hypothetical protein